MLTLNEKQLQELDELLDKIPHGYAKAVILQIQKFHKENQAAAAQSAVKEDAAVEVEAE